MSDLEFILSIVGWAERIIVFICVCSIAANVEKISDMLKNNKGGN